MARTLKSSNQENKSTAVSISETREKGNPKLPGDLDSDALLAQIIRVDHAGEYGAKRIYEGQLAVLGDTEAAATLNQMLRQERAHLKYFDDLIVARGVRPTALQPLWHVAGFALGAATGLLGKEAAMACTVAVEEVITEHYDEQLTLLAADETDLRDMITEFRDNELEHRNLGMQEGAEKAPAYTLLKAGIKAGSRIAIWLAKRI